MGGKDRAVDSHTLPDSVVVLENDQSVDDSVKGSRVLRVGFICPHYFVMEMLVRIDGDGCV